MSNRWQKERPSRLRPACIDPLDRVGLVSKGDQSLLNHRTQEEYFNTITTRFHALAGPLEDRVQDEDGVTTRMASLSIDHKMPSVITAPTTAHISASTPGMPPVIMAMRKLREAIVATSRVDEFAKAVYIFIIQATILLGHPESYHPALLYLIRRIHSTGLLSKKEESDFIGYYILDLSCRQHDLATALRVRHMYNHKSARIGMVLRGLVHGNWMLFHNARSMANVYEKPLIDWASGRMTDHAVQCLGRSYLSVSKAYVEQCTGMKWESLKESRKILWTCDGEAVIIKHTKKI
ncbi:MAG: hypothetical protein Q9168_005295 [Polycauliona sp. 1 TL-2023]